MAIVRVLLWLLNNYVPMDSKIKTMCRDEIDALLAEHALEVDLSEGPSRRSREVG